MGTCARDAHSWEAHALLGIHTKDVRVLEARTPEHVHVGPGRAHLQGEWTCMLGIRASEGACAPGRVH